MSRDASGALSSSPIFTRYSGVTDSAIVSPIASWKPSFALSRNRTGCVVVRALVEVVAELVVDRREILRRLIDAHLDAQIVDVVDVPGAGVTHDFAVARLDEQRSLPERLRQRIEPERREEALADLHHLGRRRSCALAGSSSASSPDRRRPARRVVDVRPVLRPDVAEQVRGDRPVRRHDVAVLLVQLRRARRRAATGTAAAPGPTGDRAPS